MDEIDWSDYNIYFTEYGDRILEHDVKGCHKEIELFWVNLQDAIDEAKAHHEICPLRA